MIPNSIITELKDCANTIADTDIRMQEIYNKLEKLEDKRDD